MFLIVGLGNPEEEYSKTRHNMGFDVINKVAKENNCEITKKKFKSLIGEFTKNDNKIILVKPQTYMNLSGVAVKEIQDFYKIPNNNIIIVYDDKDVDIGEIRIKTKGSGGSHNGMKNVVENLKTTEFTRIKVGIGSPKYSYEMMNYVISKVSDEEYKKLEEGINKATSAIQEIIEFGLDKTMNKYNRKQGS